MAHSSDGTESDRLVELSETQVRKALDSLNPQPPQSITTLNASADTSSQQTHISRVTPPPDADG